jgi:hypothetical protein
LFREPDILLVEQGHGDARWKELKFLAERSEALAVFARRRALLKQMVGSEFDTDAIDRWYETLGSWPGRYLMMDPAEILENAEFDYQPCVEITRSIEAPDARATNVIEAVENYSQLHFENQEMFDLNVVGYTYC